MREYHGESAGRVARETAEELGEVWRQIQDLRRRIMAVEDGQQAMQDRLFPGRSDDRRENDRHPPRPL